MWNIGNHFQTIFRLTSLKGNKSLGTKKKEITGHVNKTMAACDFLRDHVTFLRSPLVHEEKLSLMFFLEVTGKGWILQG